MRTAIWSVIVAVCLGLSCRSEPRQNVPLKRVDQTAQLELTGSFLFTVSPDDQWLVFFKRVDEPEQPEVHYLYGHLRVMNIGSGEVHSFTLLDNQVSILLEDGDPPWAADSSMCVLPPPNVKDRRVVIKFAKGEKPSVSLLPEPGRPRKRGEPPSVEQIKMPEQFTCSDCFSRAGDVDLLKKHIPKEFQFGGSVTPSETTQIVSPDGAKIYYQKGPQGKLGTPEGYQETTLHEIDVNTGKDRKLITHDGECPMIDHLRPSPDGSKLAYQVTKGCGFVSIPEIFVLDLTTGKAEYIALGSGTMHWTSASNRLFFFRRWVEEQHGEYLWVAEFEKPKPPAATRPTDKPSP